jgi:hypothetical protein
LPLLAWPMTTETPMAEKSTSANSSGPVLIAMAAWIVPGLGHLMLRRWGRALIFFVAVGGLAVVGFGMRGEVFTRQSPDPFGALGFFADICTGIFYFFPRFLEAAGPDISRAAGDYGTRFVAAAGLVNLLGVLDAYGIACGRRSWVFGTNFHLSHFSAMVIFALFVSMAFACLARKTWAARIKYALWSLVLFLAIGIGVAWLMYPLSH